MRAIAISRKRAIDVIAQLMCDGTGVISTQVMQEYVAAAGSKLHQDADTILRQLLLLESFEVLQITPALIRRGLELQFRYQINYWDASILAAAEQAHCSRLLTEDLNPGQVYATVRIENPLAL